MVSTDDGRHGGERRTRWTTVIDGSVVAGMLSGGLALWAILALTAALLSAPLQTMQRFERQGVWAAGDALRHGSALLLDGVAAGARGTR
jgi:hypothetical protein